MTVTQPTIVTTRTGQVTMSEDVVLDSAAGLQVIRASVCGTDVQIARGVRDDKASILGHECVVHDGQQFHILNPVDINHQDVILGHSYDGVFRERLPETYRSLIPTAHPASSNLVADLASLVEPIAAALYGIELLEFATSPINQVAIWGSGTMGWLVATLVALKGGNATIIDSRNARWASRVTKMNEMFGRSAIHVESAPRGLTFDAAFMCLSRPAAVIALPSLIKAVRPKGAIDLLGGLGVDDSLPGGKFDAGLLRRANICGTAFTPAAVLNREDGEQVFVTGHRGTARRHLAAGEEKLLTRPDVFASLVTWVVGLEGAVRLINMLARRDREVGPGQMLVKVVIDPSAKPDTFRSVDLSCKLGDLYA